MPTSETRVPTDRADRYLSQLCKHAAAMGAGRHRRHGPGGADGRPELRHVDHADSAATLVFDRARCTVRAEPAALAVSVEADAAEDLRQVEALIGADLERFGAREGLSVVWRATP